MHNMFKLNIVCLPLSQSNLKEISSNDNLPCCFSSTRRWWRRSRKYTGTTETAPSATASSSRSPIQTSASFASSPLLKCKRSIWKAFGNYKLSTMQNEVTVLRKRIAKYEPVFVKTVYALAQPEISFSGNRLEWCNQVWFASSLNREYRSFVLNKNLNFYWTEHLLIDSSSQASIWIPWNSKFSFQISQISHPIHNEHWKCACRAEDSICWWVRNSSWKADLRLF